MNRVFQHLRISNTGVIPSIANGFRTSIVAKPTFIMTRTKGARRRYHTEGVEQATTNNDSSTIPSMPRKAQDHPANSVNIPIHRSFEPAANGAYNESTQRSRSTRVRDRFGGRKRKAGGNLDERPAQRPRSEAGDIYYDVDYIRNSLPFPTKAEYPPEVHRLFGMSCVEAMNNMTQSHGWKRQVQSYVVSMSRYKSTSRSTLRLGLPDGTSIEVAGDGSNKKASVLAATLHAVSELHRRGTLGELFAAGPTLDKQTLKDEADAGIEVYTYAARYGLVPQFTLRKIQRAGGRSKKVHVEAKIALPEQNIEVVAQGSNVDRAEIAASMKFKQMAEQWHAQNGDQSIAIKDAGALNIANIKNFFDFYRLQTQNRTTLTVDLESITGLPTQSGGLYKAQARMDGEVIGESIVMASKKKAEDVAKLVAAVKLSNETPSLLDGFRTAMSKGSSGILMPLKPLDMHVDQDALLVMEDALYDVRKDGLPDLKEFIKSEEDHETTKQSFALRKLSEADMQVKSKNLKTRQADYEQNPSLTELRTKKAALPMTQYRQQVLDHINGHTYSVIVGATGSGKTTQVPQVLLEDAISKDQGAACNIICTQPRRIAATSVARRVADERAERLQDTVGYQVRFDRKNPTPGGSITYCTTGVILQQLKSSANEVFDTVSHIIIDEVHERDVLIDFLMILLKQIITARRQAGKKVPTVVLMSATIDSELISNYFEEKSSDGNVLTCPTIFIPGRTFPVKERYLQDIVDEISSGNSNAMSFLNADRNTQEYMQAEKLFEQDHRSESSGSTVDPEATIDWKRARSAGNTTNGMPENEREDGLVPVNLVAATIAQICKTSSEGAILAFLPGYEEMRKVAACLKEEHPLGIDFNNDSQFKMTMLHSVVPAAEQAQVFEPVPEGCRKIILSTNIAETSVTIPDVQYVVDTGKLREKRYDQVRRITKLQCTWISKSNGKQRAGRAGRVQNGNYYALYSRQRFEALRAIGLPEMLRSDLQEICLDIKSQSFSQPIRDFLAQAIEPPTPLAVDASVENLVSMEALTEDEELTPLGRLLSSLPVHPSLGKMIVLGIIFRCLDPMIVLGASVTERSLFVAPPDKRREANKQHQQFLEGSQSDHFALINAFSQMRVIALAKGPQVMFNFARDNFLHMGAYKSILNTTKQIEEILVEAGLIPFISERNRFAGELGHPDLNKNSAHTTVIKALTLAGLHPNLAVCGGKLYRTPAEKNTMIHPSSLNYSRTPTDEDRDKLLSYSTLAKSESNSILLRDTSTVTPLMSLLFGGRLKSRGNVLEMDGWLPFYLKAPRALKTIVEFRKALDRLLTSTFQKLTELKANNRRTRGRNDSTSKYLADDKKLEMFARGLVEILDKDVSGRRY